MKTALPKVLLGERRHGFRRCISLSEIACQAVINLSSNSFKYRSGKTVLRRRARQIAIFYFGTLFGILESAFAEHLLLQTHN
jgi:hypothetical protein